MVASSSCNKDCFFLCFAVKPEDNKKTIPVAPLATTENDDDITVSASMKGESNTSCMCRPIY